MDRKNQNASIDFVVPLHRYHCMVRTTIEAIQEFYNPSTVYIVTPEINIHELQNALQSWKINVHKVIVLPEETFFFANYGLSKKDVELWYTCIDEKSREFGWWYQQIIKLGAITQIEGLSDPYMVWDSDLIPMIRWEIYPTLESPRYKFAILQEKARSEWNIMEYQKSIRKLTHLNALDPEEGTFVPHHFVFHHCVLLDLFEHIQNKSDSENENRTWMEEIMKLSNKHFRFSEYKTVAVFMTHFYPDLLCYHLFKEYGKGGIRIRDASAIVEKVLEFTKKSEISYSDFCEYIASEKTNISYMQIEHI